MKSLLSKNICPAIVLQFRGPVHDVLEKQRNRMKVHEPSDGHVGYILGTAIHFIPYTKVDNDDNTLLQEQFAVTGPWPHDYIINDVNNGHGLLISATDDQQTKYGFLTTAGFFVDREVAIDIWRGMLDLSGWKDSSISSTTTKLFSYNLKPEVIDHCYGMVTKPQSTI